MVKKLEDMEIWAHRGGTGENTQDNSLDAIKKALKDDYDKIELDVWLHENVLVLSHGAPADHKQPLLTNALQLIDGKAEVYLDIKQSEAGLAVHELVKKDYIAHYDSVIFASFELPVLKDIRAQSPAARLGLNYRGVDNHFIDTAEELNVEYVTFNWKRVIPNYFNIKQSRSELDIKYLAYTVNAPYVAGLMKRLGMNGIVTDYPVRFITKIN